MSWISDNLGIGIPALFIIAGAILGAIGVVLYNRSANVQQKSILAKAHENAELSQEIARKSNEIAELYQKISEQSDEIAELNKEIAGSLTGGDSFCYLIPLPAFSGINTLAFHLNHFGKYPMYDVKIAVWDGTINENIDFSGIFEKHFGYRQKTITMEEYLSRSKEERYAEAEKSAAMFQEVEEIVNRSKIVEKSIGTITHDVNRQSVTIFSFSFPSDRDHQEYSVNIYARNGYFKQKFKFNVENGQWQMSSKLVKSISEKENILLRELKRVGDGAWVVEIVK